MFLVKPSSVPESGLLNAYADIPGCYTDCFSAEISGTVQLPELIHSFFTTPVFRLERMILAVFASSPTTDLEVANLACGDGNTLALWKVETREKNQLIMAVGNGPLRTWLMVSPDKAKKDTSRIFLGSALLPTAFGSKGEPKEQHYVSLDTEIS